MVFVFLSFVCESVEYLIVGDWSHGC